MDKAVATDPAEMQPAPENIAGPLALRAVTATKRQPVKMLDGCAEKRDEDGKSASELTIGCSA